MTEKRPTVELIGPFEYSLRISGGRITSMGSVPSGRRGFEKPVSLPGEKIYVISRLGEILYVGATPKPIRNRMYYGQNPNVQTGYHGYRWLKENNDVSIHIWQVPEDSEVDRNTIETIEAEVVFLVRSSSGKWPEAQTEIHFHQSTDREIRVAQSIVEVFPVYLN